MRAPGKISCEPLFALLRAGAKIVEVLALALGAARRHRAPEAAIVALQPLPRLRQYRNLHDGCFVVRQRDGAVLALQLFAAGAAHHGKRVAAPVEQDQRLLAALERRLGLLDQRARKELVLAGFLELAPHVDQLHLGQRPVHHAVAQVRCACTCPARRSASFRATAWPSPAQPRPRPAWRASRPHRARCSAAFLPACSSGRAPRRRESAPDSARAQRSPSACRQRSALRRAGCAATARCAPRA